MLEPGDGVPPQSEEKIVTARIITYQIEQETVFYVIKVAGSFSEWSVRKRYSQFEEMHSMLLETYPAHKMPKGLVLPPKKLKLFSSHLSEAFIEERRVLLDNFLKKLVAGLGKSDVVLGFLSTDKIDEPVVEDTISADVDIPDAEVTGVCIPATRTMSDHILYQIDVSNHRKRKTFSKWTVLKRFTQFFELDASLRAQYADNYEFLAALPPPPERKAKLFTDHMDPTFVEERRALLEHYLQRMIKIEVIVKNETFLTFLGVSI